MGKKRLKGTLRVYKQFSARTLASDCLIRLLPQKIALARRWYEFLYAVLCIPFTMSLPFTPNWTFRVANVSNKCPHCHNMFTGDKIGSYVGEDADGNWAVSGMLCPTQTCKRFILSLERGEPQYYGSGGAIESFEPSESRIIRPEVVLPGPIPKDTPAEIAQDYKEASMVLTFSTNASAALSRRCLQHILRRRSAKDLANFKEGKLFDEIEQVINSKTLSSPINNELHAVRVVGNLAAHPTQDGMTGLIVPVDPEEAKLTLRVIDKLLDYYYVQEPESAKIIADLNKKI